MDVQAIIILHKEAVNFMEEEDFDSAIGRYLRALKMMEVLSGQPSRRVPETHHGGRLLSLPAYEPYLLNIASSVDILVGKPFDTQTCSSSNAMIQEDNIDPIAAMLLFNVGLCHHYRALIATKPYSIDMRKSIKYYKSALDIMSRRFFEHNSPEEFLVVATGNNLCSALAAIGRQDVLAGILEYTGAIAQPDMKFFWFNAMFWRYCRYQHAAAA